MSWPPEFDELYSVSDLHLGGQEGFQIFDQGERLAAFLGWLAAKPKTRRVALVINGDLVDFLAEAPAVCFDAEGAVRKLHDVMARAQFEPFWRALGEYLRTDRRYLAITLGNHDLELALPEVREALTRALTDGDEAARGRLFLALDGTGFKASVGGRAVLAVHGNEVDPWNVVEHERLRQIARDRNQGRPVEEWTPNAGTKLVIDVMNDVKRKMPLVDLLKPEDRAVVPVILALDRSQAAKLTRIAPVLLKLVGSRAKMAGGFLSAGPGEPGADVPAPEDPALAMDLLLRDGGRRLDPASDLDQMLAALDQRLDEDPTFAASGTTDPQMLGRWGLAWDVFRNRDPEANLREALQDWLSGDRTFDCDQEDETFRQMDRKVGSGIDFLLTGHTHLERALQRGTGGVYFNSGTWIRLIRLRQDLLAHADTFARVYRAFRAGTMQALDEADDLELVTRPCTVVSIRRGRTGAVGELCRVEGGAGEPVPLPETRMAPR